MLLPVLFLRFWYLEAPGSFLRYLLAMDNAFLHMLSIPLFLRTFFKPLKNEYRGDLVGFSIAVGMVIKTILLAAGLSVFLVLVAVQIVVYLIFLTLPLLSIVLLFSKL